MTLPVMILIAVIVVIVGGYLFLRFGIRVIEACPGCVLDIIDNAGGSASFQSIFWSISRMHRGIANKEQLEALLGQMVAAGYLQPEILDRQPQGQVLGEEMYFLTDAGREAIPHHAGVTHSNKAA